MTRRQAATLFTRAMPLERSSGLRFADVPRRSAFEADVDRLATAGITRGCGNHEETFCPSGSVTREQLATFLVRALDG